jgi:hypothetical protein
MKGNRQGDMGIMKGFKGRGFKSGPDSFFRRESASSTAIAAILLLGILFSVFSVVHLGYYPEWKADEEHSHMANVWEDMTELKSQIDRTSIDMVQIDSTSIAPISDPNSSAPKITRNIPLHIGSWQMPLIGTTKSIGAVSVNTDRCKMTITPTNGNETIINCGTIAYHSNNKYYVDQTFKYENGALILAQKEQSVMKLYPSIRVSEVSPGNYSFLINAVEIQGSADTLSSNSDSSLYLKNCAFVPLYDSDDYGNVDSFVLTMDTDHPDAWETYFNEMLTGAGLEKDEDYTLTTENARLSFSFPEDGSINRLERLYAGKTAVNAELVSGLS